MDVKAALKRQHHYGFEMLRQCIERCPDDLWASGQHPRNFWRIAYHAVYYTDRYLQPSARSFKHWTEHRKDAPVLWGNPSVEPTYSKAEVLTFLNLTDQGVDVAIDCLDLDSETSGFSLYKMPKLDLLMLNLRHLQHHVGQLSELLMAENVDVVWAGMN
ncbi:MAG: hypothetical protein H7Y17_01840 [Chlorobia bacterium]|nr:hypothetical protein [Fimbriimonadaceae bacterium]